MLAGIGQRAVELSAIRHTVRDVQSYSGGGRSKSVAEGGLLRHPGQHREIRAGFGANTQSTIGAAMDTLDITMQDSRNLVPSIEALMEEARSRRAEQEQATQDTLENGLTGDRETATGVAIPAEAIPPGQEQTQRYAVAEVRIPEPYRPEAESRNGQDYGEGAIARELDASNREERVRRLDVLV